MAAQVEIRKARPDEVHDIQYVGLLTWPVTYLPLTGPEYVIQGLHRWWSAETVAQEIEDHHTYVAVRSGQVVGTSTVGRYGRDRVIWKMYVLPDLHGAGVGSTLMRAVLADNAREDILLEFVRGNDRARRFYERCGFVFDHEEDDPVAPAVWYRRAADS